MNPSELIPTLQSRYKGRTLLLADPRIIVLAGPTASRTLTISIGDDAVRIAVGRIVHAEAYEGRDDIAQIVAVIDAIMQGDTEELYGSTGTGVQGFIGYRIAVGGATITRLDEGADIIHRSTL